MQEQQIGLSELLEAGVHFGHQTRRWNPKMRKFIFTERNGIHIIDLRKTLDRLVLAKEAVREVVLAGERVLFVCTKRQLRSIIEQEAEKCGAFYVTERWLGGMLTNFQTIRKQIRRLKELERGQEESAFEFYTKKERLLLDRERLKLHKYLCGVKDMTRLPGAIFVVDVKREEIAVREADRLGIPVIAITDTNADPDLVGYPVPGNDDAIRSVGLITQAIAQSVLEASAQVPEEQKRKVQDAQATTYSTETGEVTETPSRPATPRRKRVPRPGILEKFPGTAGTEASAEDEKVKDEKAEATKAEDEKAEAAKAEDEKAEATKAEDEKAEATKAEDEKAEDEKAEAAKAEDEKAAVKKAPAKKADAKKGKTKKAKASAKEKVVAKAESGEAESGS
jgi:small subunit ribosomal protein S2